jgi:hypothetical protein
MASNTKNKYPADKSGSKYAEFRNTRRVSAGKTTRGTTEKEVKQAGAGEQAAAAKTE